MNKRSWKTKGLSRRLIAWLLCCVCLLGVAPISAIALEADATPVVEETATVEPKEEVTVTPEVTATASPTSTALSISTDTSVEIDSSETETPTDTVVPETTVTAEPTSTAAYTNPEDTSAGTSGSEPETTTEVEIDTTVEPEITLSLYDRLMACTSVAEVSAILDNISVEDEAEMDGFTEEQNEALEAHLAELGYYDVTSLVNHSYTIAQGGTQTVAINNMSGSNFSYSCSQSGISATINSSGSGWGQTYSGYTISVGSSVPAGTYTLTVNYQTSIGWNTTSATDTITITVTAATKSATINSIVSNAVVTYYYYTNGQWVNGGTYTDGQTITIAYNKNDDPSHYVFFAKPADNYLLSTFSIVNQGTGGTSYDLYSVENVSQSNIKDYPSIDTLVQEASNNGYLTMNGYKTSAAGNVTLNQYFTGTQPGLTVSATATPNENVKPGDEVTFHVTITPQKANAGDTVTSFEVTSLTINGVTYKDVTLTANSDGTYSTDVKYEATATDWQTGNISLNVSAQVGYEYVLPVKDRDDVGSEITTNSTIRSSGTTTVTLATASSVAYTLNYDAPEGITPPETIPAAPTDDKEYYEGDSVTVKDYTRTDVDDPTNKGTWTFTGWKVNGEGNDKYTGDTVTMGTEKILFVGTWTFTPYPNADLTIRKTVSGNMQDPDKSFAFTVTADRAMTYNGKEETTFTFNLKKDEEVLISVPVGATVTISEDASGYTYSIGSGTTITGYTALESGNGIQFTMSNDASTVVFNNAKDITIDTGVILDTLPYVLILAVVVIGVMVLMKRRRNRDDD